jgi:hypothetical protein
MMRRISFLLPAVAVALAAAAPSTASAAGWTCQASAVRATILTGPPVEPVTANAGGGDCKAASAGLTTPPALPLPLSLGVLDASTALDNPTAPVKQQTARAQGGVADLRVQALPGLPIDLPKPDLSGIPAPLRPTLEALLAQRLPTVDLLDVQVARAQATASCQGGAPRLSGSSTLAGVTVNGQSLNLDGPVTKTVQLIDSRRLDPAQLAAILGVPAAGLPTVTVPATLATIKLTPGERVQTGVRLTQRALHAEISIAGQNVADVVLGEATVGSADVRCGGVADLALECSARRIVLIDVKIHGRRVKLTGAADRRFAGRRVRIRSSWNGHTVARPKLSRTGLFHATAKLPPRAIRRTNDARYQASIRRQKSLDLKLVRRMLVTRTTHRGGSVRITGRVTRPLASPVRTVVVTRRVSCGKWKVVKRFTPHRDGRFSVRVSAPVEGQAAAYRMRTKVRKYVWLPKLYPTFTLPRYVELG